MSNYENMIKFSDYYSKLYKIEFITSPHKYYLNKVMDILKGSNNKIQIINELYYEIIYEQEKIPIESTVLVVRQVYFRNAGMDRNIGTIIGEIKGRLLDKRKLMEKYEIDEKIIEKCV